VHVLEWFLENYCFVSILQLFDLVRFVLSKTLAGGRDDNLITHFPSGNGKNELDLGVSGIRSIRQFGPCV